MSFTTTAYYRNFSVIPDPQVLPAPIDHVTQIPTQNDFGTANSGTLTAGDMMVGSLYFNPTGVLAGGASAVWTLPTGDAMMKSFGKNLGKFCTVGSIVRLEVVNYGTTGIRLQAGAGGSQAKLFTGGNGTGLCDCLNIKFTTSTGTYIVF